MALIVETGVGLVDAESYISVADATAYHLKMGNQVAWALVGDNATMEAMLRRATNYMRGRYYGMWVGVMTVFTQRLDWPRIGAWTRSGSGLASSIVPGEVQDACAELALRAASASLLPDTSQSVKREKVGPIEVEYDAYSPIAPTFTSIDEMLAAFLIAGARPGVSVPLMRA